jgi:hypothetical protein
LGPPSLLYNWYRVFSGVKAAAAWRLSPTPSSAEVKERVELYLYLPLGLRGLFQFMGKKYSWFHRIVAYVKRRELLHGIPRIHSS